MVQTYVRVLRGDDPARRPRRVLRLGRATRRSATARAPGHRRRGVVLAASYEAKAHGVRAAMGGAQARRLCPHAIVVPPRMAAYSEASKAVFAVFDDTTPLVEGLSIDEAFLDVRGLRRIAGTPTEIALRLRDDVVEQVGLPITVGIARTKFLAKVASGVAKPNGLLEVPPDGELAFLHPLPVERLWGVGRVTAAKLHSRGITTVGDRSLVLDEPPLVGDAGTVRRAGTCTRSRTIATLGPCGSGAAGDRSGRSGRSAGARDRTTTSTRSSSGSSTALPAGCGAAHRACRTVVLRLRFADFSRATRSHTLPQATTETRELLDVARGLLAERRRSSRRRASRSSGSRSPGSKTPTPFSWRCRSIAGMTPLSMPRSTRCATASERPP